MLIEKFKSELLSLVDTNIPIILIDTSDIETIDRIISQLFQQFEIYEFHIGNRLINFQTKKRIRYCQAVEILEKFDAQEHIQDSILLLKDFEPNLQNYQVLFYLKSIAFKKLYREGYELTTILVSQRLKVPEILNGLVAHIQLPNPDFEELTLIVADFINSMQLKINREDIQKISKALIGLNRVEALQVLNRNYQIDGFLDFNSIKSEKIREIVNKIPLLKYIETTSSFKDIGGLSKIRDYLNLVHKIYSKYDESIEFGVDIPKGIVIYGGDGTGKELMIQASSQLMNLPIISLSLYKIEDVPTLQYILKSVLSIGEAIFWIDGLSNSEAIFEEFVSWMKSIRQKIFTIVTTESWSSGRRVWDFDEVFNIGLLNEFERDEIFRIHLQKRGQLSRNIDIFRLVNNSSNLNGAEIEFAVKNGILKAFVEGKRELTTEDILLFIKKIKSKKKSSGEVNIQIFTKLKGE